jgi:acyl-CoA reductase-like NAD-dependent aldehyde dehydrogenase
MNIRLHEVDVVAKSGLEFNLSSAFDGIYETKDGIDTFKMLIGEKWRFSETGNVFDIHTPIDGSTIARAQLAALSDVDWAVISAKERGSIRELPAIERIEIFNCAAGILEQHKDELARVLQLEAGKTSRDAKSEVEASIHRLRLTMEEARRIFGDYVPGDWSTGTVGKIALVIREPVGVIAAITPFNYPLYMAVSKITPALLAGNTVVVKPSSTDPISALLLVKILENAGVPEYSLNIITGKGDETGDALITNERLDMINFTGSTPIGRRVSQLAVMKRLHLELGGKGYALVLEDANLNLAAERCVFGSLKYSGQRCDAVSAILAMEPIADELVERILKEVDGWKFGDPRDESVVIGPVINLAAVKRIHAMVMDAQDNGADLLRGGRFHEAYYEPTVLDNVPIYADIAREETFGPVITIMRFKNVNDALSFAKKSRYGLESCVFTNDFYKMWHVAKALECGEVTINDYPQHGVSYFPFGGVKDSGMGREGVGYSIDEMTNLKTIVFNLAPAGLGKREISIASGKRDTLYKRMDREDGE